MNCETYLGPTAASSEKKVIKYSRGSFFYEIIIISVALQS
jgi:hypothetical protein